MSEPNETIKERLTRVEGAVHDIGIKVDNVACSLSSLQQAEDRRYTDRLLPERVRQLEDWRIAQETRDRTLTSVMTRVFGVSVVGAVSSVIAIIVGVLAIIGART